MIPSAFSPAVIGVCNDEGILLEAQHLQLIENPTDAEVCLTNGGIISFTCDLLHLNRPGKIRIARIVRAVGDCANDCEGLDVVPPPAHSIIYVDFSRCERLYQPQIHTHE